MAAGNPTRVPPFLPVSLVPWAELKWDSGQASPLLAQSLLE
jgi:hypothetical protein